MYIHVLKATSNCTHFSNEYIYTHSKFKQIRYCNEFLTLALTKLMKKTIHASELSFELPVLPLKHKIIYQFLTKLQCKLQCDINEYPYMYLYH